MPNIEVACYFCSIDPPSFDAQHHKKVIAPFFFMLINNTFNFFDCCVSHVIIPNEEWLIGVSDPYHVINWLGENNDVVYLVPPQII